MQYLGKVIGVAVALLMGGGFWGVVLGFLVGHMFDRARSRRLNLFANQQERQSLFFSTTFEVMGHLTKIQGPRYRSGYSCRQCANGSHEPAWRLAHRSAAGVSRR